MGTETTSVIIRETKNVSLHYALSLAKLYQNPEYLQFGAKAGAPSALYTVYYTAPE